MNDDIVARLRLSPVLMYSDQLGQSRIDYEACKKYINNEGVKMMREAADEIERLRAERDGYLHGNRQTLAALAEANEIAKKYKDERDEARRSVCCGALPPEYRGWGQEAVDLAVKAIAEQQGWDCYKEKP